MRIDVIVKVGNFDEEGKSSCLISPSASRPPVSHLVHLQLPSRVSTSDPYLLPPVIVIACVITRHSRVINRRTSP